jgi:hypothetical protein
MRMHCVLLEIFHPLKTSCYNFFIFHVIQTLLEENSCMFETMGDLTRHETLILQFSHMRMHY